MTQIAPLKEPLRHHGDGNDLLYSVIHAALKPFLALSY